MIVLVIGPASGAVPELVNVTGTLLGEPATNGVAGCPTLTAISGVPLTAIVGVIGVAVLSAVEVSPATGVVIAVNGVGEVPTVLGEGVTGIVKTAVFDGAVLLIGPGVEQVTVCPLVLHVEPFVVNDAGALVPTGKPIVVIIGPVAGDVPAFVNVTGTLLGLPATKGVAGCPIVVTIFGEAVKQETPVFA